MEKAPDHSRAFFIRIVGVYCVNQAVAVRDFLIVISSFARNQSSCS